MPYEVSETGWGEFEIVIKIYFQDPNERPVRELLDLSSSCQLPRFYDFFFVLIGDSLSRSEAFSYGS